MMTIPTHASTKLEYSLAVFVWVAVGVFGCSDPASFDFEPSMKLPAANPAADTQEKLEPSFGGQETPVAEPPSQDLEGQTAPKMSDDDADGEDVEPIGGGRDDSSDPEMEAPPIVGQAEQPSGGEAIDRPAADAQSDEPPTLDGDEDHEDGGSAPRTIEERPSEDLKTRWVVILAGQSNMVGLGRTAELALGQNMPIDDALIYYDSGVHNHPDSRIWREVAPGFGSDRAHFGPELGIARTLRAQWPDRPLAFIKVAEGGTHLRDRWRPGGDLFDRLITQIDAGMASLEGPKEMVGLIWMQGESDGSDRQSAANYGGLWTQFIRQIRMELEVPALPVIAGLIRPNALWPHADIVRAQTVRVSSRVGNVETVETMDLSVHEPEDPAHFDTQSNLILGRRFASAFIDAMLIRGNQAAFGPQGESGWFYLSRGPFGDRPMEFDAERGRWASEAFSLIGDNFIHPGLNDERALLRWVVPYSGRYRVAIDAEHIGEGGNGVSIRVQASDGDDPLVEPTELFQTGIQRTAEFDFRQGQTVDIEVSGLRDVAFDTVGLMATPTLISAD